MITFLLTADIAHHVSGKTLTFDLICDVIGCTKVNDIGSRRSSLAGLSNAILILNIEPVVSDCFSDLAIWLVPSYTKPQRWRPHKGRDQLARYDGPRQRAACLHCANRCLPARRPPSRQVLFTPERTPQKSAAVGPEGAPLGLLRPGTAEEGGGGLTHAGFSAALQYSLQHCTR